MANSQDAPKLDTNLLESPNAAMIGVPPGRRGSVLSESLTKTILQEVHRGIRHVILKPHDARAVTVTVDLVRRIKRNGMVEVSIWDSVGMCRDEKIRRVFELTDIKHLLVESPKPGYFITEANESIVFRALPTVDYLSLSDRMGVGRGLTKEAIIRPSHRCNQHCVFCWIERVLPDLTREELFDTIRLLGNLVLHNLVFSGGEPTLSPFLRESISLAKQCGILDVVLQTNGVLLERRERVDELLEAGLNSVVISLHSHNSVVSDSLTGLPGSQKKTVAAFRHFIESPAYVTISHVLCRSNLADLPDFARFLLESTRSSGKVIFVNLAWPQPMGILAERFEELSPRLNDLRAPLLECLRLLTGTNVMVGGFCSACGIPLCALDGHLDLLPIMVEERHERQQNDFADLPGCRTCDLHETCFGLRHEYVKHFGDGEIRPITRTRKSE